VTTTRRANLEQFTLVTWHSSINEATSVVPGNQKNEERGGPASWNIGPMLLEDADRILPEPAEQIKPGGTCDLRSSASGPATVSVSTYS
jgi:hypothetical protein